VRDVWRLWNQRASAVPKLTALHIGKAEHAAHIRLPFGLTEPFDATGFTPHPKGEKVAFREALSVYACS